MPTRKATVDKAVSLLENAEYPNGFNESEYGLGIYQVLMWHEQINAFGIKRLPHIIDADKLKSKTEKIKAWQRRAIDFEEYLADRLGCNPDEVHKYINLLFKQPEFEGLQGQNPRGIAFVGLIANGIEQFTDLKYKVRTEVDSATIFPGIVFPGRSKAASIDVLVEENRNPVAVVSIKWSVRHDRINDLTNECPAYKAAAQRLSRIDLKYYVVTNEFDRGRLDKILDDTCIDGVVHVDKNAVINVCEQNGKLNDLIDLPDFFKLFK